MLPRRPVIAQQSSLGTKRGPRFARVDRQRGGNPGATRSPESRGNLHAGGGVVAALATGCGVARAWRHRLGCGGRMWADLGRVFSNPCSGDGVRPHLQPVRSTIRRTGRLLTPSMPVSSSAFPARPPQSAILSFLTAARDRRHRECWSLLKNCSNLARLAVEVPGNPPVPLSMERVS